MKDASTRQSVPLFFLDLAAKPIVVKFDRNPGISGRVTLTAEVIRHPGRKAKDYSRFLGINLKQSLRHL